MLLFILFATDKNLQKCTVRFCSGHHVVLDGNDIFEIIGIVLNLKFMMCHSTDRLIVFVQGNSACQAIELLIQKGVPEAHIIFLNLISVSCFFCCMSTSFANSMHVINICTDPSPNQSVNFRLLKASTVFANGTHH